MECSPEMALRRGGPLCLLLSAFVELTMNLLVWLVWSMRLATMNRVTAE